ncbi:MAG: hypothetical protein MJ177_10465, partial [Clostridia bacterium]|nr:hypothetical protein [Clostridia bacterium]
VCKHTLKICRQSLHLDSTKHQEHLACTGDYYIESLMTLYCFDDFRLSEFDIMRTADWLVDNNGRMFHTTYSLIWVQMLHDVYMITGNKALLTYSEKALDILLDRFAGYMGESGVIETPPDFMFVDWTVIDGYTMHHPPKALGQTVLNAFYYEALSVTRIIRTRFILRRSTHLLRYTPLPYESMPQSYALHMNTSAQNKIFDLKSSNFVRVQGRGSRKACRLSMTMTQ